MIALSTTLLHALLICIPFSIFAVFTFWRWPRLWLHSLPPDIAAMAGPKSETEVRQTRWLVLPILLILPGLSMTSLFYARHVAQIDLTVLGVFTHLYAIWFIVHLWDLIIIDFGHILLIDAQHPPVPGTEGAAGYEDYAFHSRAFAKACLMSLLFVVPVALTVGLLA